MFELKTEPAPAGLAALGQVVELRERDCAAVEEAIHAASDSGKTMQRMLAITLHVDGQPIGYEALGKLPGRFFVALGEATQAVARMYGYDQLAGGADADAAPKA